MSWGSALLQGAMHVAVRGMAVHCAGMTGFCAIQGIPIVQYVNAKARTDEWPPKYWKVATLQSPISLTRMQDTIAE